jgi:hypothetical protein
MTILLLAAALGLAIQTPAPAEIQLRPLSQKRDVLQAEVAITKMSTADLKGLSTTQPIEHVSEVSRSDAITAVVTIQGCQADDKGGCSASADIVTYRSDGSVHTESKNVTMVGGRGTATVALAAADATGIYKVVATVRDLNARRFAKVERLFGVK